MTCRELTDFLMDYLSGDVPAAERAVFEDHLAKCPPCVRYLESYKSTVEMGHAAFADPDGEPVDVPEELVQAILAARRQ